MKNNAMFRDMSPLDAALLWLVKSAAIGLAAALGVATGMTLFTLTTAMLAYGLYEGWIAWRVLLGLDAEATACERDAKSFRRLDAAAVGQVSLDEESSLLARHVAALNHMRWRHGRFRQGKLIAALDATVRAQASRIGHAANVLVVIGLLGTLMGLTEMSGSFVEALKASGTEAMLAALRVAVGGMTTAYVTTIVATFAGSLVLRGFAYIAETTGDLLVSEIAAQSEFLLLNPTDNPDQEDE